MQFVNAEISRIFLQNCYQALNSIRYGPVPSY